MYDIYIYIYIYYVISTESTMCRIYKGVDEILEKYM